MSTRSTIVKICGPESWLLQLLSARLPAGLSIAMCPHELSSALVSFLLLRLAANTHYIPASDIKTSALMDAPSAVVVTPASAAAPSPTSEADLSWSDDAEPPAHRPPLPLPLSAPSNHVRGRWRVSVSHAAATGESGTLRRLGLVSSTAVASMYRAATGEGPRDTW